MTLKIALSKQYSINILHDNPHHQMPARLPNTKNSLFVTISNSFFSDFLLLTFFWPQTWSDRSRYTSNDLSLITTRFLPWIFHLCISAKPPLQPNNPRNKVCIGNFIYIISIDSFVLTEVLLRSSCLTDDIFVIIRVFAMTRQQQA